MSYILSITRQISVPALQNLKIYVQIQPCLQSRWSQQHIALKVMSLKMALITVMPGRMHIPRMRRGWVRSYQLLRVSWEVS